MYYLQVYQRNEVGEFDWEYVVGDQTGVPAEFNTFNEAYWALENYDTEFAPEQIRVVGVAPADEPQFKLID